MIDEQFTKETIRTFSDELGVPITLFNRQGTVLKECNPYFSMELLRKTPKGRELYNNTVASIVQNTQSPTIFPFDFGLSWLCAPVDNRIIALGPIRTESFDYEQMQNHAQELGLDNDELDELSRLTKQDPVPLLKCVSAIAKLLLTRGQREFKRSEKIERLEFLQKLADAFASSLNIQEIMRSALAYIVETFHLDNCSITIFDENARYAYRLLPDPLKHAEGALRNHLESVKNVVSISSAAKSFMFERIENIQEHTSAIMAYPLLAQERILGMMVIYKEEFVDDDLDMMPLLVRRLAQSLSNSSSFRKMRDFAVTDKLTGLYNRAYFNEFFKKEIERGSRSEKATSLLIFDIDDFKKYNDQFGHPIGDQVLVELGKIVRDNVRSFDTACRYGGEEFCIVMPEVPSDEAFAIAERLRTKIEQHRFGSFEDRFKSVTVSMGLVTCMNSSLGPADMLSIADKNLYQAKSAGKNRVFSSIVLDKALGSVDVQQANSLYSTKTDKF